MWIENFGRQRPRARAPSRLECKQLAAITTPTLILGAEYGMRYSRRIVELLHECIGNSRLAVLPSVTHFMSYQSPDTFNELLLSCLSALD